MHLKVCVDLFNFYRSASEGTFPPTLLLWMDARESVSSNHATIPMAPAASSSRIKLIFISLKPDGIPLPFEFLMGRS